ncbi:MAG: response regulator transcription factor [Oscillospiraceae bacterium]|nr:response regulator transcription factor [Oscillospiraceae bacterium]
MKQLIYVIEDDKALQELYTYSLENEFESRCFDNWSSFHSIAEGKQPDLIILDVMLPGEDGFSILSKLKADTKFSHIPVIMVSAKGEEFSKVRGLNLGADDYMSKPFGVLELVARIKANLRKNAKPDAELIVCGDITIDREKHQITINGSNIQTTLKEYNLLCLLCQNAEKVQAREKIFNEIWGESFIGETRTLDIHIKQLRSKLKTAESKLRIETVRGVGYKLV